MRVVLISRGAPWPLTGGGALRTHAVLTALAQQHDVVLSCPAPPADRPAIEAAVGHLVKRFLWVDAEKAAALRVPESGSRLRRIAAYFADFFTHVTPRSFRQRTPAWEELLRPELATADAVVCRHADSYPLAAAISPRRIVVDADDLLFLREWQAVWTGEHGLGSVLVLCESLRAWISEQLMALRCARTLVASTADRRRLFARSTTLVLNGATFANAPSGEEMMPGRVVFVGNCAWEPNFHGLEWFLRDCWPGIRARIPEATFAIVGGAANGVQLPFAAASGIVLAENVPSVQPWLEGAVVSVVPVRRGAGTRIKIIDAIGYGTPVVSTPVGAAGLTEVLDESLGLTLAADADAMIEAIGAVLADPEAARRRAAAGREIVRARFTWDVTTQPLVHELASWVQR